MPKQTAYLVVNRYDFDYPIYMGMYDNRTAAEQHAAHLNGNLNSPIGGDEDDLIFEVWEEAVLSKFNP